MTNSDFTENLFQSIDTIVNARMANLPYDQTLECEVININEASAGRYLVRYQASTFIAISNNNASYQIGDIVYVQIPQGNFTLDKFIINKKSETEQQKVKKLPFLSFVKNENLSPLVLKNKEFALKTSGDNKQTQIEAYTFRQFYKEPYAAGYTKIGLKVGIKLNIPYKTISGNYGIKLILKGFNQHNTYLPVNETTLIEETREYNLSIEDMISSNYYNTFGYCNQEQTYDIKDFVIKQAIIILWQNGQFFTSNKQPINDAKIYFNNISLYLGYDTSEFKNNDIKCFLYTTAGYKFDTEYYTKPLYIRFVKAINNYSDLEILTELLASNQYTIYWEEYDPNIKINGPQSNLLSFRNLKQNNIGDLQKQIIFEGGQSRLRYSFVVIITDLLEHKYISNQLEFIKDTYLSNTELLDLLTGFFRIDENGKVYLNGGSYTNDNGLNLTNIILNDYVMADNARIRLQGSFSFVDSSGNILIEISNNKVKLNIPLEQM